MMPSELRYKQSVDLASAFFRISATDQDLLPETAGTDSKAVLSVSRAPKSGKWTFGRPQWFFKPNEKRSEFNRRAGALVYDVAS